MSSVTSYRVSAVLAVAVCVYFFTRVFSGHPLSHDEQLIFIGATVLYLGASAAWVRK